MFGVYTQFWPTIYIYSAYTVHNIVRREVQCVYGSRNTVLFAGTLPNRSYTAYINTVLANPYYAKSKNGEARPLASVESAASHVWGVTVWGGGGCVGANVGKPCTPVCMHATKQAVSVGVCN